jgi:hypothetical protein
MTGAHGAAGWLLLFCTAASEAMGQLPTLLSPSAVKLAGVGIESLFTVEQFNDTKYREKIS